MPSRNARIGRSLTSRWGSKPAHHEPRSVRSMGRRRHRTSRAISRRPRRPRRGRALGPSDRRRRATRVVVAVDLPAPRAPYSYDWIDNLGKRSPQQLTPGLDQPAVGQTVMRIFRIASFARDEHLTVMLDSTSRRRPPYAMAYVVTPNGPSASRLVVHIRASAPHGLPKRARRVLLAMLASVDLMMTRRQLRNLKALAERDAGLRTSATACQSEQ